MGTACVTSTLKKTRIQNENTYIFFKLISEMNRAFLKSEWHQLKLIFGHHFFKLIFKTRKYIVYIHSH